MRIGLAMRFWSGYGVGISIGFPIGNRGALGAAGVMGASGAELLPIVPAGEVPVVDLLIAGPFRVGAFGATRGDTLGELPMAVGQGKLLGAMPPI